MYQSNRSLNIPPGHTLGIGHLCRPGEEEMWLSESSRGWGIWYPCVRGGEFERHPRFHVKSLVWQAIMGHALLEDFRGKDCAFVANWLPGKGLSKLWYLNSKIFNIGFRLWIYEYIKLCIQWNTISIPAIQYHTTLKGSTEVNYFHLPHVC